MFENILLEPGQRARARHKWNMLAAMASQACAVAAVAAIPLLRVPDLPQPLAVDEPPIVELAQKPAASRATTRTNSSGGFTPARAEALMQPNRIPKHVAAQADTGPAPVINFETCSQPCLPGGVGNIGAGSNPPTGPPPRLLRFSHLVSGQVMQEVQPVYPPLAKQARIQGDVVLEALIGSKGTLENLQVISGHPLLAQAALGAVRQWRFRPYVLNGQAIAVETRITVNFRLDQ